VGMQSPVPKTPILSTSWADRLELIDSSWSTRADRLRQKDSSGANPTTFEFTATTPAL
jgi:hypothetical protein